MKKLMTLSLALIMVLTFSACGSTDTGAPADKAEAESSAEATIKEASTSSTGTTDAQLEQELKTLDQSAKKLAEVCNEIIAIAKANGWENDELFMKESNATAALVQVDNEIIQDPSMLEGKSAQDMIDGTDDMAKEWDTNIREKVSKVYVKPAK